MKIRDKHTRRMVEIVQSDRLEIHKVRREDMGAYLCIASNDVPPAVSKRIYLRVQFPPYILPGLSVLGTAEGEKLTLECIVESYPQSFVVWSKGDRILHQGGGPGYTVSEVPLSMYRVTSKLTLTSYTRAQAGPYKCLGKNSLGEAELTTRVYTTEPEKLVPRQEVRYELIPEENLEEQKEEKEVEVKKETTRKKEISQWTIPDSTKAAREGGRETNQNQRTRRPSLPSSEAYQGPVSPPTVLLLLLLCISSFLV